MKYLNRFYHVHKYHTYHKVLNELRIDEQAEVYSEDFFNTAYEQRKIQLKEIFPYYSEDQIKNYIFSMEDVSELLYLIRVFEYENIGSLDIKDLRIYMLRIMSQKNYSKYAEWLIKGISKHRRTMDFLINRFEKDKEKAPIEFRQLHDIKWCNGWIQEYFESENQLSLEIQDNNDIYYQIIFRETEYVCKEGETEKGQIYYYELFYEEPFIYLNLLTQYNELEIKSKNVTLKKMDNPYKIDWL